MYRIALMLVCFMCLMGTAEAQKWSYGAYVGMNGSRLSGDSPKNFIYSDKLGPTFGGILNYYVKPDVRISFQPGYSLNRPSLLYQDTDVPKGEEPEIRDSIELLLDYLKLPFFIDVLSNNRKWHFMAGLDLQISLKRTGTDVVTGEVYDFKDELSTFNPVVYFGLGRRFPIFKKPIMSVDPRFGQGVLNLSNERDDETSLVPRIKTSAVELLVTVEFNNKD